MLQRNSFFVESPYPAVLRRLLRDPVVRAARARSDADGDGFLVSAAARDSAVAELAQTDVGPEPSGAEGSEEAAAPAAEGDGTPPDMPGVDPRSQPAPAPVEAEIDPDRELHSFEIEASQVRHLRVCGGACA